MLGKWSWTRQVGLLTDATLHIAATILLHTAAITVNCPEPGLFLTTILFIFVAIQLIADAMQFVPAATLINSSAALLAHGKYIGRLRVLVLTLKKARPPWQAAGF